MPRVVVPTVPDRSPNRETGTFPSSAARALYDPALFEQHRELRLRAYGAVKVLRLALANYQLAAMVDVPGWFYEGRIYPF